MRDPENKDTTISVRVSGEEERIVDRPYDDLADLIGSVTGLPADLSEGTGARFAEIILPAAR